MKKIVAISVLLFIVGTGSWYGVTKAFDRSDVLLSDDVVSQMIQQKYGGTIETIRLVQTSKRQDYTLTLLKDQLAYDLIVNGQTGEVLSFSQQKRTEQETETVKNDEQEQTTETVGNRESEQESKTTEKSEPDPNVQSNENADPESSTIPITEDQAKKIASAKVSGTITSAELDDEDDQLVYEVEIDQSKTKEATVIINAYSGKIESITFEMEDEDD